jgi:hypothetical protein
MGLDQNLMARIAPHNPTDLLDSLSAIATIANHDVLHQLTSTVVSESITSSNRNPEYGEILNGFLTSYLAFRTNEKDGDDYSDSYEAWALNSHAETYREIRRTGQGQDLDAHVEKYFDALARIDRALEAEQASEQVRHRYVDYLGTVALYSLVRILPIDDPLLGRALTRMETLARPDGSDLVQYMRDRYLNPKTQYPERADLKQLGKLYLELLDRPEFMTDHVLTEVSAALSLCVLYECDKPYEIQNKMLRGAGGFGSTRGYDQQPVAVQETMKAYARALAYLNFDEEEALRNPKAPGKQEEEWGAEHAYWFQKAATVDWPSPTLPDGMRLALLNKMKAARSTAVSAMFRAVQSYLHRHKNDPDFDRNIHRLGLIHFDGLRRQVANIETEERVGPGLAYQVARNYRDAGVNILGAAGMEPTWRQMKTWDIIRTTPVIPYMLSPDSNNPELARLHRVSKTVDRGMVAIVGTGQAKPRP